MALAALLFATAEATALPPLRGATQVANGASHSCVLTDRGGVQCWGRNHVGQLGDGGFIERAMPADVVGLTGGVVAISAGGNHTCALTAGGAVKCWGDNSDGQLGINTGSFSQPTPVDVPALQSGVAAISAGGLFDPFSCALTTAGGVKCWGSNAHGQLGDGSTTARSAPADVVGLSGGIAAIGTGGLFDSHACALTDTGGVKCWGAPPLGNGSTDGSLVPVDVTGLGSGIAAISVGGVFDSFTCALTDAGAVTCWGATPQPVAGLDSSVEAIAVGGTLNCALIDTGGVKCWGFTGPESVAELSGDIVTLDSGSDHVCAVNAAGEVACWGGANGYGELGDGHPGYRTTPQSVESLAGVVDIAASKDQTCVITAEAGVACWGMGYGRNPIPVDALGNNVASIAADGGQICALGDTGGVRCMQHGAMTSFAMPGLDSGVAAISAGGWVVAQGCALTTGGTVKCWTDVAGVPADIAGIAGATAIGSGDSVGCAVTGGGGLECWGVGILGDGSTPGQTSTPVDVFASGIAAIGAGVSHTCALGVDGGLSCWGHNLQGQLGSGTFDAESLVPLPVSGLESGVAGVSAGWASTCAVTTQGAAKCWGFNAYGQVGNGSTGFFGVPTEVAGLDHGVAKVSAGQNHSCALTTEGDVLCWGSDISGQLGIDGRDPSVPRAVVATLHLFGSGFETPADE